MLHQIDLTDLERNGSSLVHWCLHLESKQLFFTLFSRFVGYHKFGHVCCTPGFLKLDSNKQTNQQPTKNLAAFAA